MHAIAVAGSNVCVAGWFLHAGGYTSLAADRGDGLYGVCRATSHCEEGAGSLPRSVSLRDAARGMDDATLDTFTMIARPENALPLRPEIVRTVATRSGDPADGVSRGRRSLGLCGRGDAWFGTNRGRRTCGPPVSWGAHRSLVV